ncbi:MAG: serine/threonine protein kinase [Pseudomonas sp.]|nr:MAG: serine/threonine protein kinase [Pseudomonas sp.]
MKHNLIAAVLVAGFLAAGTASAQTTPGTKNINSQTGVSDRMQTQRPSGTDPESRAEVKSEAKASINNLKNTDIPKGQASTRTNGQINAAPKVNSGKTRAEVRNQARMSKPKDGQIFVPAK